MAANGIIFNIQRFSVDNGPGIRTTIYIKGCPMNCLWCSNPEGIKFGRTTEKGSEKSEKYSINEILNIIEYDRIFHTNSGGGVTFSGGEPLAQPGFLTGILERCKSKEIHTVVDTSGYADIELIKSILKITDLFLYNIKFIDPVYHLKYTKVSNREILENLDFIINSNHNVIIRIPLIPNITATTKNLEDIKNYISQYKQLVKIALLPFNNIAENKINKYGIRMKMSNIKKLNDNEILKCFNLFNDAGFDVSIGR